MHGVEGEVRERDGARPSMRIRDPAVDGTSCYDLLARQGRHDLPYS